ncbi:MAG: hypothetical protein DRN83_01040 [Hadesarchaea archaeon]|nr:MAG: hypothetical protein DRN83_01040 [Hadesarchaea archaeon]HDI12491.1 hypothetical protein [Hadesarchaea archaeon]
MALLTDEKIEELDRLLTELKKQAGSGIPVIVEGADDIKALRNLGVEGRFYKISGGKSMIHFIESFSGSEKVIVLTDFDRTGDELAKFCARHLKQLDIEPIIEIRKKLKSILHKEVKDIEGLAKFLLHQYAELKN